MKKIFIGTLCFILLLGLGIQFMLKNESVISPITTQTTKPIITPTPDPDRSLSFLLLGYGGGKHEGGLLTDTMILAQIQPKTKHIFLISLPRDIWVSLPVNGEATTSMKLNAAYAVGFDDTRYPNKPGQFKGNGGGPALAKYAATIVSGIPVDYAAAFSFKGFTQAIDTLDGIDVTVAKQLKDPFYPIAGNEKETCGTSDEEIQLRTATASGHTLEEMFSCRFETLEFEKGIQHMDGSNALKYVRSRHAPGGGGDFDRSRRQREIIQAMKEKILAIGFLPKIIPFMNAWNGEIHTDIPVPALAGLLTKFSDIGSYEIQTIGISTDDLLEESTSPDGQYILMPKAGMFAWDTIRKYLEIQMEAKM